MNFTVLWTVEAQDELTEIWLSHWDRAGVTAATHRIDTLLARDPEDQGESRPDDRRIMFDSPLVVIYRIVEADRQVIVSRVRQY
jgi:plasmid stabilization system protein ParE